ncbi:MAG: O-antigen ligase family protein [Bacteroidales bacterium]|nr:O-antigen ligase family protein [Bacteroidales bacterium]
MEIIKKVSLISLLIFLFLLPFGLTEANIGFFVFILGVFVNKDLYKNLSLSLKTISKPVKYFIIFSVAYWLWCIVSLLWSEDFSRGVQLCGRYIMLMAFPVSFYLAKVSEIIKNTKILVWVFIAGIMFSSFVCLYLSYLDCWVEGSEGFVFKTDTYYRDLDFFESVSFGFNHFSYSLLSHFLHPSYYSLYFLFSIIFILNIINYLHQITHKIFLIFLIIYMFVFIYMLQSRGNFLALIGMFAVFLLYTFIIKFRLSYLIIGFTILCIVSYKLIFDSRLSIILNLMEQTYHADAKGPEPKQFDNVNDRIIIWRNALQVIKENPILGVGIGDTDTELEKQYQKNNVSFEFGTHNQYIYAQLSAGVVGLLLLLTILFVPIYYGIKNRYFPLIGFSVAVMINLLFENMLTRNAGLMFFPWAMMALLMMSEENKKVLEK